MEDILESLAKIERFTKGLSFEDFAGDELRLDAVLRNFTIIGEAASHVPPAIQAQYPALPWHRMRAMRNIVVHDYGEVSVAIIWDTLRHDLPPLAPLLRELLEQA